MKIILKQDVKGLGRKEEIVNAILAEFGLS